MNAAPGCPGYARHWFVARGTVGLRSPECIRCGVPNPRRLTDQERREYDGWHEPVAARATGSPS